MIDLDFFKWSCDALRRQAPIIHCITNYVAMEFNANALLAVGASPLMSCCIEEMDDIVPLCGAVVINIGCLDINQIECMKACVKVARRFSKPWVLDPVGVGISAIRRDTCLSLIEICPPAVIRGNGSEAACLSEAFSCSDKKFSSRGVDSSIESGEALGDAVSLASKVGCTVSVSGPVDYITDGKRVETIVNGSAQMCRVTAMGCTATALTAAFAAVCNGRCFDAALNAMALMGTCGEAASGRSSGTGSFKEMFLDELSNYDASVLCGKIVQI